MIGSLLIDGESLDKIHSTLAPDDFDSERNRTCYAAALSIYNSGGAINAVTVARKLNETGDLASVGGGAYLGALVTNVPTSVAIVHYAGIVERCARQRDLLRVIEKSADTILHPELSPHAAAQQLSEMMLSTAPIPEHQQTRLTLKETMDLILENAGKQAGERFPTGFKYLDRDLGGGLERGSLAILAADTGIGKTTLATQWAMEWAQQGKTVGIMSFEMAATQLGARMIADQSNVPSLNVEMSIRNDSADTKRIMEATGALSDLPLVIETKTRDVDGIDGWIRREHRQIGLDVVVVDHLQLLPSSESEQRVSQIDSLVQRLKRAAMDLNILVVGISQPNRANLRDNSPISLSALRDSHGVGMNADVVIGMYEPKRRGSDKDDGRKKVTLHFAKNRFGPSDNTTSLEFDATHSRFRPWPKTQNDGAG